MDNRAKINNLENAVPPYVPENLREQYQSISPALEKLTARFIEGVEKELPLSDIARHPAQKYLDVAKIAFEVGVVAGFSFAKDNPDL